MSIKEEALLAYDEYSKEFIKKASQEFFMLFGELPDNGKMETLNRCSFIVNGLTIYASIGGYYNEDGTEAIKYRFYAMVKDPGNSYTDNINISKYEHLGYAFKYKA